MKNTTLALVVSCALGVLGCGADKGSNSQAADGGHMGPGAGNEAGTDASPDGSGTDDAGSSGGGATGDGGGAGDSVKSAKAFYFGHSLVGHDLPQMLRSFARARGNTYDVSGQVGWGTPIMSHWRWQGSLDTGFVPLGFPEELRGSRLFSVDGHTALESGEYDVIVLTESNGFVSGSPGNWASWCNPNEEFGGCTIDMTTNLVRKARLHNDAMRAFVYSNWKSLDDFGGSVSAWAANIEADLGFWENLADETEAQLAREGATDAVVAVIPGGPIFARVVLEAEAGKLERYGIAGHGAFIEDDVHPTRLGFYVVALAHYASMFRESPVGLPNKVDVVTWSRDAIDEDGFEVDADLAAHLQDIVWEELSAYPRSGVGR